MISQNYAVMQVTGGTTDVKCNNAQFGDPLPGVKKACYLDDVGILTETKITNDQQYFAN